MKSFFLMGETPFAYAACIAAKLAKSGENVKAEGRAECGTEGVRTCGKVGDRDKNVTR
jgi:hypothetical protein